MYSKGILSYSFFFSKLLHMKNLHQCSCWRICFLKKKIPTQAVRGAVGGQETKWKSETTTYYNHLHHHLLLLCQTSSTKSPNFIFPCAALTVTQISKLNEMLILNSLFAVHYLSVCLEPTVEVPRIKNTNLSKDSIQFCISHFSGHKYWASNPFSVKISYKFESLLWPWSTTTPWSSGGLLIQQNITSSSPPLWHSTPD